MEKVLSRVLLPKLKLVVRCLSTFGLIAGCLGSVLHLVIVTCMCTLSTRLYLAVENSKAFSLDIVLKLTLTALIHVEQVCPINNKSSV